MRFPPTGVGGKGFLAHSAGFEPATFGFEDHCSCPLSYECWERGFRPRWAVFVVWFVGVAVGKRDLSRRIFVSGFWWFRGRDRLVGFVGQEMWGFSFWGRVFGGRVFGFLPLGFGVRVLLWGHREFLGP